MTYFIRGTIRLTVTSGEKKISVVPLSGFMSPDKPKRAIVFPESSKSSKAKLVKIAADEKSTVDMDMKSIKKHLSVLVQIAAIQKPVELRLKKKSNKKKIMKIVGFAFPA